MGTRNFHWSSVFDCVMHETDQSGSTLVTYTQEPQQYGPLLSENRGGAEYYHHYDAIGSTTFLTNDTGAVTDTFLCDAWGNSVSRVGSTPTSYQWIGRWRYQVDVVTGAYYVRERAYLPTTARWMSVDPADLQTPYVYAELSPINNADPSGLMVQSVRQPPWTLFLVRVAGLTDGSPGYLYRWFAGVVVATLPPPPEERAQFWLLNKESLQGLYYDQATNKCKIANVNDVVLDVANIKANMDGNFTQADKSQFTSDKQWCVLIFTVTKTGGINGNDPESRLPTISDWHNPPPGAVNLMETQMRASFTFTSEYTYFNTDVCKNKCKWWLCPDPPFIQECLGTPWGSLCDQNWP